MGSYTYSGYLWPAFGSTVLIAALGWYGWRHRRIAGALPFFFGCVFAALWSIGDAMQTAAVDPDTKTLWLRFVTIWQLPVVTSAACFLLQYSGLGRWVTRRTVMLLAIPPLVFAAFIVTDGLHHLVWTGVTQHDAGIMPIRGPVNAVALAYSYLVAVFNVGLLAWLALKFPRYRWPAILMLVAQLGARFVFEIGLRMGLPSHWGYGPFVLLFLFGVYAVALFGFHVFDPVPIARAAAIDQMLQSMLVLDLQGRIVDANAAAQRTLAAPISRLRGRMASDLLPEGSPPWSTATEKASVTSELSLGESPRERDYVLEATPLKDRQGRGLGQMLLLHDVTEQKATQARLLEQERVVGTLQERERLARELHDGIGQVFGYLSMQAQTVRHRLRAGDSEKADALLARLVEVAQDAHADVRESITDLKAVSSEQWSFIPALDRYLRDLHTDHGIETELSVGESVDDDTFRTNAGVQVLRVVQEALANARRHGGASAVRISIECEGSKARITVADDGSGFDPARFESSRDGHFGLAFMRERMAQVGGHVHIDSRPGAGTRVILEVPLGHKERDGGESTSGR
ncbi:MAG: PAS domain-containing protein [Thermoleophilia bacterium]|nr:PAS domain-containing protein [Thermoleophilia bacterium]